MCDKKHSRLYYTAFLKKVPKINSDTSAFSDSDYMLQALSGMVKHFIFIPDHTTACKTCFHI